MKKSSLSLSRIFRSLLAQFSLLKAKFLAWDRKKLRPFLKTTQGKYVSALICIGVVFLFLLTFTNLFSQNQKPFLASLQGVVKDIGDSPVLLKVSAEPQKVKINETLTITAEIKDKHGIEKVSAIMPHERGADEFQLSLIEGDNKNGKWQGEWTVHDTINKEYITFITAVNIRGRASVAQVSWWDDTETVWYDQNYPLRKKITFDNATPSANYQVKVTNPVYDETGLVGSWHLDGGTSGSIANGTTAGLQDTSGNGNNGTASNANGTGMAWTTDKYNLNGAVSFDGTDDYVNTFDTGLTTFTVEAWIKPTTVSSILGIMGERSATAGTWAFYIRPTGELGFTTVSDYNSVGAGLSANTWQHVAAVVNGTSLTIYLGGNNVHSANIAAVVSDSTTLKIGDDGQVLNFFNGTIDEVRIYNRALSADEIKAHYEAKAKLNYGDVRFVQANGTLLDYWMEKDGTFWVEVATSGTSVIYIYYGNPSASSASNGTNTFIQYHGASSVDFLDALIVTLPFVYEAKARRTGSTGQVYFGVANQQIMYSDDALYINAAATTPSYVYGMSRNEGAFSEGYITPVWPINVYYSIKIKAISSINVVFYPGDGTNFTLTTNIPDEAMGLGMYQYTDTGDQQYSFIRKYASPEPTPLQNFKYRKSIPIEGSTAGAQTNFQTALKIGKTSAAVDEDFDLGGNVEDDFDDIRFTNSSGTVLDYWIESVADSGGTKLATVWVEVPSIAIGDSNSNTSEAAIYIYYGNPSALSASNGANTFEFFDDFSPQTPEPLTEVDPNGHIEIDRTTDHRLEWTGLTLGEDAYVYKAISNISNFVLDFDFTFTNSGGTSGYTTDAIIGLSNTIDDAFGWDDSNRAAMSAKIGNPYYTEAGTTHNGTYSAGPYFNITVNTTYYVRLIKNGTSLTSYFYTDAARTNLFGSSSVTCDGTDIFNYAYALASRNMGYSTWNSGWSDNYKLRKYASPEPDYNSTIGAGTQEATSIEEKRPHAPGTSPSGGGVMMF